MRTIAIIADYNPFHNGHQLQLRLARENYGADRIVVVMTGNFTQRGDPAVFSKTIRAEMAIKCGADVVIEIPFGFATSGLDNFSKGAITMLNGIESVDYLLFGSECGSIDVIKKIALSMQDETSYKIIRSGMSKKLTVEECRSTYLDRYFDEIELPTVIDLINMPNNILGILYLYNLIKIGSKITPVTHRRVGQDYLDESKCDEKYASATSIRRQLKNGEDLDIALKGVPKSLWNYYKKRSAQFVFFEDLLGKRNEIIELLKHKSDIYEFDGGTYGYIEKHEGEFPAKIKRSYIHVLAGLTVCEMDDIITGKEHLYYNVLAYREERIKNELFGNAISNNASDSACRVQRNIEKRADGLYKELLERMV